MKYTLESGSFIDIMHQCEFLISNQIDVNMDNGKCHLNNLSDYIKSLELLIKYEISGYKEYRNVLNKAYTEQYNEKIYKNLDKEEYEVLENKNGYVLSTKSHEKYLYIVNADDTGDFPFYSIVAKDNNIDETYMNFREIPFHIGKNSPLYSTVKNMYKNLKESSFTYQNELGASEEVKGKIIEGIKLTSSKYSHIRIDEVEDGYNFIVVKDIWNGENISRQTACVDIGTPYLNDKWLFIDNLYGRLQTIYKTVKNKIKKLLKK